MVDQPGSVAGGAVLASSSSAVPAPQQQQPAEEDDLLHMDLIGDLIGDDAAPKYQSVDKPAVAQAVAPSTGAAAAAAAASTTAPAVGPIGGPSVVLIGFEDEEKGDEGAVVSTGLRGAGDESPQVRALPKGELHVSFEDPTRLDPQQWAEELAKTTSGTWWVDAVILGRLARLAQKYSTMRAIHGPFYAWKQFLFSRRERRKIDRRRFFQVLFRSWRYRLLVRNPKTAKIMKGAHRLKKIVRQRIHHGWDPLSRPVLIGRNTRQFSAMASVLQLVMLRNLAYTFRDGRLMQAAFRAFVELKNTENERAKKPPTAVPKQESSDTEMGDVWSSGTEEMMKSRPFIKRVMQRAWARWQRSVKWWMNPSEWQLWHTEAYYHGEIPHPPRAVAESKTGAAPPLADPIVTSASWGLPKAKPDDMMDLGSYYNQVLGGSDEPWIPFPSVGPLDAAEAQDAEDDFEAGLIMDTPRAAGRVGFAVKNKFSAKLRGIAHKIGGTSLLTNKSATVGEKLVEQTKTLRKYSEAEELTAKPTQAASDQPVLHGKYSPRTLMILRNVDRVRKITAPVSEKEKQSMDEISVADTEDIPPVSEIEPMGVEPISSTAAENEAKARASASSGPVDLAAGTAPEAGAADGDNSPGDETAAGDLDKPKAPLSAYMKLKRTVTQKGEVQPVTLKPRKAAAS